MTFRCREGQKVGKPWHILSIEYVFPCSNQLMTDSPSVRNSKHFCLPVGRTGCCPPGTRPHGSSRSCHVARCAGLTTTGTRCFSRGSTWWGVSGPPTSTAAPGKTRTPSKGLCRPPWKSKEKRGRGQSSKSRVTFHCLGKPFATNQRGIRKRRLTSRLEDPSEDKSNHVCS